MNKIKVFASCPGNGKSVSMLLHALSSKEKKAFVTTEINTQFLLKRIQKICNNMQLDIPSIINFNISEKYHHNDIAFLIQSGYKEIYIDTFIMHKYSNLEISHLLLLCDIYDCTIYATISLNRSIFNIINFENYTEQLERNDYFDLYAIVHRNDKSEIVTNYNNKIITTPTSILQDNEQ